MDSKEESIGLAALAGCSGAREAVSKANKTCRYASQCEYFSLEEIREGYCNQGGDDCLERIKMEHTK